MRENHGNHCGINICWSWIPKTLESSYKVKIGSLVDMITLIKKEKNIPSHCLSSVYLPHRKISAFGVPNATCKGAQASSVTWRVAETHRLRLFLHQKDREHSQPAEITEVIQRAVKKKCCGMKKGKCSLLTFTCSFEHQMRCCVWKHLSHSRHLKKLENLKQIFPF